MGRTKFKQSAGTPRASCATQSLSKKLSLIKRVQKDLENSIFEFTEYLNSCVCLHQRKLCS